VFGRESHNLQLFTALSDKNPQLQLAAAAVLVERLKRLKTPEGRAELDAHEQVAIIRALISVTKVGVDYDADGVADIPVPGAIATRTVTVELGKFVADSIAQILEARDDRATRRKDLSDRDPSPLLPYDWQWAKLRYAWWPAIDARKLDFFNADLRHSGLKFGNFKQAQLREANLSHSAIRGADFTGASLVKARFIKADLRGAAFAEADLEEADFTGADLRGADLRGARNCTKANFAEARYDGATQLPKEAEFDPKRTKMTLIDGVAA